VLTAAKAKQAERMIADGTPLVEVATVIGVSRSTLYRQLRPKAQGPGQWAGRFSSTRPSTVTTWWWPLSCSRPTWLRYGGWYAGSGGCA